MSMQLHVLDDQKLRIHDDDNEANSLTSASERAASRCAVHARTHYRYQRSARSHSLTQYLAGFQLLH